MSNYINEYKRKNYKVFNLIFTPSDMDLYEELQKYGNGKSQYIKKLIKEDMERRNNGQ